MGQVQSNGTRKGEVGTIQDSLTSSESVRPGERVQSNPSGQKKNVAKKSGIRGTKQQQQQRHKLNQQHPNSSKNPMTRANNNDFDVGEDVFGDDDDYVRSVRKLSIVSNRNVQLLSMKPLSDKDSYADGLRSRRRSSLINLILGAPSSGPRFSDDLCSLNSHMSDLCSNFGIDYFPDASFFNYANIKTNSLAASTTSSTLRLEEGYSNYIKSNASEGEQCANAAAPTSSGHTLRRSRRPSSLGSLASFNDELDNVDQNNPRGRVNMNPFARAAPSYRPTPRRTGAMITTETKHTDTGSILADDSCKQRPSLSSVLLASIDLTKSIDVVSNDNLVGRNHDEFAGIDCERRQQVISTKLSSGSDSTQTESTTSGSVRGSGSLNNWGASKLVLSKEGINQVKGGQMLHRSGSELFLFRSGSPTPCRSLQNQQHFHNCATESDDAQAPYCCPCSSLHVSRTSCTSASNEKFRCKGKKPKTRPSELNKNDKQASTYQRETKLIIILQVCLPFILAGFGSMAAGLALNKMAQWRSFQRVPNFFVLLPSFIGLKGNIEMTLASRLSTLANLNLITTSNQRWRAYISNLVLILSQAIGLSIFAALAATLCEFSMGKLESSLMDIIYISFIVVLPCALTTSVVLVFASSIIVWWSIWFANLIQVNPDNLSTLVAALYGDVSCVITYGLFAELMYSFHQQNILLWPIIAITIAIISWPIFWYTSFRFRETHDLSLSSMPPMLTGIVVSLGSGSVLSLFVGRYARIALYQPVVNGFGANLIAVQASRVSTWLWCNVLRRMSTRRSTRIEPEQGPEIATKSLPKLGASLASFTDMSPTRMITSQRTDETTSRANFYQKIQLGLSLFASSVAKLVKILLWSFVNSSPNSVAARLLLIMIIPAHTLYFFVIWLLSPSDYVVITWPFYTVYIGLCLTQVFILLLICEPLMRLLMRRQLDPDIFGISLLMALADLVGTLCLTAAFCLLAHFGDPNAF